MVKKKTGWFINIIDKIEISQTKFCPAHYLPHKLPIGKKIKNECCHYHKAKWRMLHHKFFCKILKCPHSEFMIKMHNNDLK